MKTKPLALLTLTLLPTLFTPAFAADLPLDTPTEDFTINNRSEEHTSELQSRI